jgi:hypothetical protein
VHVDRSLRGPLFALLQTPQNRPREDEHLALAQELPRFVRLRGGGYFFLPGVRAQHYIASGLSADAGAPDDVERRPHPRPARGRPPDDVARAPGR